VASHLPRTYVDFLWEEMHINDSHCGDLIEKTAAALNEDAVKLMFVAVQRNNVELSVKLAWRW
jgi:hypothetical protein